jgi:N-acetylneuraminic acid mutarotase
VSPWGGKFVVNGKLYTFGGFTGDNLFVGKQVDVYDPATNTWSQAAPTPIALTHAATAVDPVTGTVYVGMFFENDGIHSSNKLLEYHPDSNTWTFGPTLPAARGAGGMALVGRELHAWGGLDVNFKGHAEHWRLDLDHPENGWVTDTPLPEDVNHMGSVALNGKIYSIGGIHDKVEDTSNKTAVRVYDPATRLWTDGPSLPIGLGHIGPDTYSDGSEIVIAGGQTNGGVDKKITDVFKFDPNTGKWSVIGNLPEVRKSAATAVIGGKIVVANGNTAYSPFIGNKTFVGT